MEITAETLSLIAGAVLSLAFSYIPGLNQKFASLSAEVKRLIMAGILAVVSVAIYFLGCKGILVTNLSCDQAGIVKLVMIFIAAVIANQSIYAISPRTDVVKSMKVD